jgi:hypothetical protein
MTITEIKKYSAEDILDILVDLGKKLSNNDILIQCAFYKGKSHLMMEFHENLFYNWVLKVIESNHVEFEKRLRANKIKKINLNLDHTS